MDKETKYSYKSIVCENPIATISTDTNGLVFSDYEDVMKQVHLQTTKVEGQKLTKETAYKKELLLEMLNDLAHVTEYVREYYGSQGIGDELHLEDILNAFEDNIRVDMIQTDNENDFVVSGEEDT